MNIMYELILWAGGTCQSAWWLCWSSEMCQLFDVLVESWWHRHSGTLKRLHCTSVCVLSS